MLNFKFKNPFTKLIIEKAIDLSKPLNITSVLEIGENQIIPNFKKSKIGKRHEKINLNELGVLKIKQNSYDMVVVSDFLDNSDPKKIYKEAHKISSKYVLITQNTNPFNFFPRNKNLLKIAKVRGVKIVSKRILPTGVVLIVRKQGNRA